MTRRGILAVVVTYESAECVGDCLRSLIAELDPRLDGLVVVDNASTDGTLDVVREIAPAATVIALPANVGFGRACNAGAVEDSRRDLLFVNPDAVLDRGCVRRLTDALTKPGVGIVGPRVERLDGRLEPGCLRSLPDPVSAMGRLVGLDRRFPNTRLGAYNRRADDALSSHAVGAVSGCAMLVDRVAWDTVGGFDEDYFMYGEDLDICHAVQSAGWSVWYEADAHVVHVKGGSSGRPGRRLVYHFHRSMWLYFRKNLLHGVWAPLTPLIALAVWGRCAWQLVGGRSAAIRLVRGHAAA